jgi:hypothetical protein
MAINPLLPQQWSTPPNAGQSHASFAECYNCGLAHPALKKPSSDLDGFFVSGAQGTWPA